MIVSYQQLINRKQKKFFFIFYSLLNQTNEKQVDNNFEVENNYTTKQVKTKQNLSEKRKF